MNRWHDISANRRALAYILFSVIVLGAMILGGIAPVKKQTAALRDEAVVLDARIETQEALQPVYRELMEARREAERLKKRLPAPETEKRRIPGIDTAAAHLSQMAADAGVQDARFSPAPDSVAADSDLLLIDGALQGQYGNFRVFLSALTASPGFSSLESLVVRSTTSDPEYRLKIWMEIE